MHPLIAWIGWFFAVSGNGFIVFMWVVFGLAAAAGADTSGFVESTVVGVAISLILSLSLMAKRRFLFGVVSTLTMVPLVMACAFFYGVAFQS